MIYLKSYLVVAWILLFMCRSNGLRAQNIPDSLFQKLAATTNDSTKAITLLEMGESIEVTTPEKSMDFYRQALVLGQQIKNNRVILSSYIDVGNCNVNLNKMDSAIIAFEKAIPFARLLNDTVRVARVLANIGNAYLHKKDRVTAIEYYLKSARIWETSSDQKYLTLLYSNINALLDEQKEHNRALEFGNKAIELAKKIGDKYSLVSGLVNLSTTYSHLGQHEKEYEMLEQALPLAKDNKDLDQIATVYHNMGDYYFKKNNFSSALDKYLESYSYVNQMGNQYHLSEICTMLALTYHKLNLDKKALQYILQAEQLAGEVGVRTKLKEIYLTRAEIEQKAGNYKLASEYFSKTITVSDSLFKTETSEKVAEVEAQYQNEKKQKEIVQLEKDKQVQSFSIKQKSTLNYILIGSLVAFMIVGFLIYRNLQQRQRLKQQVINELEKDKQLVAVDSLLKGQEEERSRMAKDLHDGLGSMLSGVKLSLGAMKGNLILSEDHAKLFSKALDQLDNSIGEMRRVAHNMMPEALVKLGLQQAVQDYCDGLNESQQLKIKHQFHGLEKRLDAATEIVVYRIVQELLNNVVKHSGASEVLVQIMKHEDGLNITIEDNGKGFDIDKLNYEKGAGLSNVRSRVDYLKGQMDIQSVPGKGTSIHVDCIIENS